MQLDHSTSAIHHTAANRASGRTIALCSATRQTIEPSYSRSEKRRPRVSGRKSVCIHQACLYLRRSRDACNNTAIWLGPIPDLTEVSFPPYRYQQPGPSTNKPPSFRIPRQWHRIDFYPMDKNSRPTRAPFSPSLPFCLQTNSQFFISQFSSIFAVSNIYKYILRIYIYLYFRFQFILFFHVS